MFVTLKPRLSGFVTAPLQVHKHGRSIIPAPRRGTEAKRSTGGKISIGRSDDETAAEGNKEKVGRPEGAGRILYSFRGRLGCTWGWLALERSGQH